MKRLSLILAALILGGCATYPKAHSLEDMAAICKTPEEVQYYAKEHFIPKKRDKDVIGFTAASVALANLQAPDDSRISDSIDCDDDAVVKYWVLCRNGYDARLIEVQTLLSGHAIVAYRTAKGWTYIDNHYRIPMYFATIPALIKDVYYYPKYAYVRVWNDKTNCFVRGERIEL